MKIRLLTIITLFAFAFTFNSCSELDKLLTFNIKQESSFTINANPLPISSPIDIATPDVTTNSSETFKNNNTKADLVKDVKLQSLKLNITNPSDQNFDFLKSIHIYISTDSSDEIELAYADDINSTSNSIDLTCTKQKLNKYLKAQSFKLRSSITTRKTTSQDITFKANMNFRVTADPL